MNHRSLRGRGLLSALVVLGVPLAASCDGYQESNVGSAQQASVMAGALGRDHNIRGDEGWDESAPIQVSFGYDDGPDVHSLELAKFLHSRGVHVTFFMNGIRFRNPYTGYCDSMPSQWPTAGEAYYKTYIEQVLDLGHRAANHTESHCGYSGYDVSSTGNRDAARALYEVMATQQTLDSHIRDGVRLLRHPYGEYRPDLYGLLFAFGGQSTNNGQTIQVPPDPNILANIWGEERVGATSPDWAAGDLGATTSSFMSGIDLVINGTGTETGPGPGYQVPGPKKNKIITINHDRIEPAPGSDFALRLAKQIVPRLQAARADGRTVQIVPLEDVASEVEVLVQENKGFSPSRPWDSASPFSTTGAPTYDRTIRIVDMNGDGDGDVCARRSDGIYCAFSSGADLGAPQKIYGGDFTDALGFQPDKYGSTVQFPDIDNDGRPDVCGRSPAGIRCALQQRDGTFGASFVATDELSDTDDGGRFASNEGAYSSIRFADVDGDGKTDLCARTSAGVACMLGRGDHPSVTPMVATSNVWWSDTSEDETQYTGTLQLADIDGDGKADLCMRKSAGVQCLRSDGAQFTGPVITSADFGAGWSAATRYRSIRVVDVDGDGKADVCGRASDGVRCALSQGTSFLPATLLAADLGDSAFPTASIDADSATLQFGDLNRTFNKSGNLLHDVCVRVSGGGLRCAVNKLPSRPLLYPESCREVQMTHATLDANGAPVFDAQGNLVPNLPDGLYTLYHRHDKARPWQVWCDGMASNPEEYLPVAAQTNFSRYWAGEASPGTDVVTSFDRIRVNPKTLVVDIADQTFATSYGSLYHGGEELVTSMPYGVGMNCANGDLAPAKIDLRGTNLRVASDAFSVTGFWADGSATYSAGNQVVDLLGTGYCGWISARGPILGPFNQRAGFALKLEYVPPAPATPSSTPATCQAVKAASPSAIDGTFTLYYEGDPAKPWKAHCKDMATSPREYLILPRVTGGSNFSQYTAGGQAVRTYYARVRIDPSNLRVDASDQTYAMTVTNGDVSGSSTTSMPYAAAVGCDGASSQTGVGNIDLRGTPFWPAPALLHTSGVASTNSSSAGQVLDLHAGGNCGWIGAGSSMPVNGASGTLPLLYQNDPPAVMTGARVKASDGGEWLAYDTSSCGIFHLYVLDGPSPTSASILNNADGTLSLPLTDGTYTLGVLGTDGNGPGATQRLDVMFGGTTLSINETSGSTASAVVGTKLVTISSFGFTIPYDAGYSPLDRVAVCGVHGDGYQDSYGTFTVTVTPAP